jgi:hypothetical protein
VAASVLLVVGWTVRPAVVTAKDALPPQVMRGECPASEESQEPKSLPRRLVGKVLLDNADSWRAMRAALTALHDHPGEPLYQGIFSRCIKFQYPPSSLLAMDLLGVVLGEAGVSNPLLNALSYAFLVLLLFAMLRIYTTGVAARGPPNLLDRALPVLFALVCYPVLKSIELGQIQTWLNGMFALSVLLFLTGRPLAAGVLIGLMATIKPQMGLFLVWALVRREWILARGIALTAAVVMLLSLLRYGLATHLEYLGVLSSISRHGESYMANQSFNGLLLRALHLGPNIFFDRSGFAPYHPAVRWGTLVTSLAILAFALIYRPKAKSARGVDFGLAAVCFTVASPIAWEHHYGIFPVVFAVAAALLVERGEVRRSVWVALGVAWVLTAVRFAGTQALYATPLNFLQSHVYFGALLLIGVLHVVRRADDPKASPARAGASG